MASSSTTTIHVNGFITCPYFRQARDAVNTLQTLFPKKYRAVINEFPTRDEYHTFLTPLKTQLAATQAHTHTSCPFVATGPDFSGDPSGCVYLGGCDATLDFCRSLFGGGPATKAVATMVNDVEEEKNDFDYDLIVIGGGSGGLAASKQAAKLGAKVALLDFVKPSPQGTQWGLGGTCVNVGCIPKKLMHQGSILGELAHADAAQFGWVSPNEGNAQHDWPTMVSNIQGYIKSLNFKYKVALRDEKVKYINGLGEIVGPHRVQVTEFKGKARTPKSKVITANRVLIAVGGRPSPLTCPGGEFAISSDDLFSLPESPGKTLCIGAGYVSLECGGFLSALGCDVTVAVRSILLRGFDRECCDKIGAYMEKSGTKFKHGVTPASINKLADNKLEVTFSDESVDVFDTVLCATGRYADTAKLGLESVGLTAERNGKLSCVNEQTSVPWIYAIGDVIQGRPELTPVAIQAGIMLAKRLYGDSSEPMDYVNIATAVFTPIEYGSIGLSEEDASTQLGSNMEVYHSDFTPLEWALSAETRGETGGFCKVIVDKEDKNRIVGMHYLGPNAGEVMQGYALGMKTGATFDDLANTVGIHPTTSEVLTTLTVTKSSGASAAGGGC